MAAIESRIFLCDKTAIATLNLGEESAQLARHAQRRALNPIIMQHEVASLEDLPEGEGFLFRSGPYQVALFREGESVSAIDNECPHAGASLAGGETDGNIVACPFHGWEFDCRTGECLSVEGFDVATYPVTIENGMVKLTLPDN